jgi:hypothetical protein
VLSPYSALRVGVDKADDKASRQLAVRRGSLPLTRKLTLAPTRFGTSYFIRHPLRSYSIDYLWFGDHTGSDAMNTSRIHRNGFCRFGIGRRTEARKLGSDQLLHVDRHFGQRFDSRAVFAQSVLHHAEIEAGDHDVIPSVSDSAQRYVQHGDNLIA